MIIKAILSFFARLQKWLFRNDIILRYRVSLITLFQCLLVLASYAFALSLRFDFQIPENYTALFWKSLPFLLVSRLLTYDFYKLNSGWWSYASMYDLVNITKAVGAGSILFLIAIVFVYGMTGYPRSVIIIEAITNLVFMAGLRFGIRWAKEAFNKNPPTRASRVLIVGAGKAGSRLLNEIRTNPQLGIHVIGLIDDDPLKTYAYVQGVQVLGSCADILHLVKKHNVDEILFAIPSAPFKKIAATIQTIRQCGVTVKVLPGLSELMSNKCCIDELRDVHNEELLGRPILKFRRAKDLSLLRNEIENKTVLITGSGGSIGSELVRQAAKLNPRALILYERNENNLFYLEQEIKMKFPDCKLIPVLGDVLDRNKLTNILAIHNVNLIYHAAAYKHVPMMEREPFEAVRNNIFGTKLIVESAVAHSVDKFIFVSTDKAVNPVNIMGITKRICEMIVQSLSYSGKKFIAVRFGNVIGSNGSVIPTFKQQIASGGPVTITHPETSRYFMTIPEAVQLLMTAGAMGQGGEIFLLDMGTPIKVLDLARKLIVLSGLTPDKDIEIVFTGLRPGEKLHEELYWEGEGIVPTSNKKITMLRSNGFDAQFFATQMAILAKIAGETDEQKLKEVLLSFFPEHPADKQYKHQADFLGFA
jgi:FlaA1/EpsC-like NDP-sugar epimerase